MDGTGGENPSPQPSPARGEGTGPVLVAKIVDTAWGRRLALHFPDGSLVPGQTAVELVNGLDDLPVLTVRLVVDGRDVVLD